MQTELNNKGQEVVVIYRPFYTLKSGKKIFKKDGGMFRFEIPKDKYRH